MKMNIGSVNSGYHFINFMMAENGMSEPPVPQSARDATAPTMPMAAAAGVLVRYALSRYLRSKLYTGTGLAEAMPAPVSTPLSKPAKNAALQPARRKA